MVEVGFDSIERAIEEIRQGKMIILVDDEDRENEGDLVIAAEHVTPDAINFMTKHGRGLVCLALTAERVEELGLPMMVERNTAAFETAFTVSIEAKRGVTTGISAADRATTVLTAIHPDTNPLDLARPGHVFPLRARPGGVLVRAGQTEGSVDLARLAGVNPSAVICEIMKEDGSMARVPDLAEFAARWELRLVTIKDLIRYRMRKESLVTQVAETLLPTQFGEFRAQCFVNTVNGEHHVALVKGEVRGLENVLVRVHSECMTGDVFHSLRCDCGSQLEKALERIEEEGKGVLLYMNQEGRGIGLVKKLQAYALQDQGKDTVEANAILGFPPDLRDYGIGAQILRHLGLTSVRLMTNNPRKVVGLDGFGLKVVERIPIEVEPNVYNHKYLKTKCEKLGHVLRCVR